MVGTASLLAAGFPSLGQSVLSGIDSSQELVLKRTAHSSRLSQIEMQTSVHVSSERENPQNIQFIELEQREVVVLSFELVIALQLNYFML